MYLWVKLLHILAAFAFAFFHGASAMVIFRLRNESEPARMAALLNVSSDHLGLMNLSLLIMLASGVAIGYLGDWWGSLWIWVSLGLLVLLVPAMYGMASKPFTRLRKALGLEYMENFKIHPGGEPAGPETIASAAAALKPWLVAGIGYGTLILIIILMVMKPF
jgi:hypothetical protein